MLHLAKLQHITSSAQLRLPVRLLSFPSHYGTDGNNGIQRSTRCRRECPFQLVVLATRRGTDYIYGRTDIGQTRAPLSDFFLQCTGKVNNRLIKSRSSDFTSIASSIRNYVYENGRRYHSLNAGKYVMPNDEVSSDAFLLWLLYSDNCPRSRNKTGNNHHPDACFYHYRQTWLIMSLVGISLEMGHHTISLILEGELQLVKLPEKLDRVLDLGTGK
jgi:hypothetical protein